MPPRRRASDALLLHLRSFGLAYPGAHPKSPWPGHLDLAVDDKTFAYLSLEGEPLSISCKLPHSGTAALLLPNTTPTAYGLGRSGWVSARFDDDALPPASLLEAWIDESYRAQAKKRRLAELAARGATAKPSGATAKPAGAPPKRSGATPKPTRKKPAPAASPTVAKAKATAETTPVAKRRAPPKRRAR
jgi:predicted DNA-binding protein (MmcQ/YjbR family)